MYSFLIFSNHHEFAFITASYVCTDENCVSEFKNFTVGNRLEKEANLISVEDMFISVRFSDFSFAYF